ncbi:MAG: NAD-dependent epimerase/dehydratase family protein, partial [Defluviitaleaceae bacterium]|nr:NAD-dependent epimerase/dehydratase family protein [Defluviitaleaceae bacterium]
YIANSLRQALSGGHRCDAVSVRWQSLPDMAGYDAVVHCAGIVHRKRVKSAEYMSVNTDLTIKLAEKAKSQGVRRFIFMSTMAVYGMKDAIGMGGKNKAMITRDTVPQTKSWYGRSKLMAEEWLKPLAAPDFRVDILRLPMVYGSGCPGNYAKLARLARTLPVFPDADNERSMLYIGNLCEFVRLLLKESARELLNGPAQAGNYTIYCPQNREYARTTDMVRLLAQKNGKKIAFSKKLGRFICVLPLNFIKKLFGNLTYDLYMSAYFDYKYCVKSTEESVEEVI